MHPSAKLITIIVASAVCAFGATLLVVFLFRGSPNAHEITGDGMADTSDLPAFGCQCAGADRLLRKESAFIPAKFLITTGSLNGKWLSPTSTAALQIRPVEDAFPPAYTLGIKEDEYALEQQLAFRAAYDSFRVYGIDVDADGRDEVVLEAGIGQGSPGVYVQTLKILRVSETSGFQAIFATNMNGYLPLVGAAIFASWERVYSWIKIKEGSYHLKLKLIPPPAKPAYAATSKEARQVFQHPIQVYRLNKRTGQMEVIPPKAANLANIYK